ncbi:hypothetical protein [Vibrio sp. R78045]|uniref:hypothetical protein n=1 Tax=Vibrio sp. R78045 TaxID=3093868 RepID=UPI0036F3F4CE
MEIHDIEKLINTNLANRTPKTASDIAINNSKVLSEVLLNCGLESNNPLLVFLSKKPFYLTIKGSSDYRDTNSDGAEEWKVLFHLKCDDHNLNTWFELTWLTDRHGGSWGSYDHEVTHDEDIVSALNNYGKGDADVKLPALKEALVGLANEISSEEPVSDIRGHDDHRVQLNGFSKVDIELADKIINADYGVDNYYVTTTNFYDGEMEVAKLSLVKSDCPSDASEFAALHHGGHIDATTVEKAGKGYFIKGSDSAVIPGEARSISHLEFLIAKDTLHIEFLGTAKREKFPEIIYQ